MVFSSLFAKVQYKTINRCVKFQRQIGRRVLQKKDVFTSYLKKGRMSRIPSVVMKGTTIYYTVFCMNKFRCLHDPLILIYNRSNYWRKCNHNSQVAEG